MMRVNIDDKIETDTRVTFAAARLQISRFEFIGRVIPVWMNAYRNRSAIMPMRNVDALAELPGFAVAMIEEDLATLVQPEMVLVRLRGVTERIEFLEIQDAKRAKANAAKRAAAGLPPAPPPGTIPGHVPPARPYSHTQDQDQDQDQTHTRVAPDGAGDVEPEALRLARKLIDRIAEKQPTGKIAKLSATDRNKKATSKAWAPEIEKLHRLDGIPYSDIESAITWCQDSTFWSGCILSGQKLREKYDTLEAQRRRGNSTDPRYGRVEPSAAEEYPDGEVTL